MNRETMKIVSFIEQNEQYKGKLISIRERFPNYKDFMNQVGYVIMEILSNERQFYDYPRNDIQISKIVDLYF